jgi:hypothetical protein
MPIPAGRDTQLKRAKLYPDVVRVSLDDARLCLNCDIVHNGDSCPVCASATFLELSSVIGRLPQNVEFQLQPAHAPVPELSLVTSNPSVPRSGWGWSVPTKAAADGI